jgi:hypothetical protein
MPMSLRSLLLAGALALPATAQTVYYSAGSTPLSAQAFPMPLGQTTPQGQSRIAQVLVSRFRFANVPVRIDSLSFAPTADAAMAFQRLIVRMGYLPADLLDFDFANNRSTTMATVLDVQRFSWPLREGEWNDLGLQTPFVYTPALGNLVIEIQATNITGATSFCFGPRTATGTSLGVFADYTGAAPTSGSGVPNVALLRIGEGLATTSYLGQGCNGSSGTAPALGILGTGQLGTTASIVLSNARPSQLALLLFGFSTGAPLPQDLTVLGMPGCFRYCDAANTVGLLTNTSGVASFPLVIPNQGSLVGAVLYEQYFAADATANAAGFVAANYGRILVGR